MVFKYVKKALLKIELEKTNKDLYRNLINTITPENIQKLQKKKNLSLKKKKKLHFAKKKKVVIVEKEEKERWRSYSLANN